MAYCALSGSVYRGKVLVTSHTKKPVPVEMPPTPRTTKSAPTPSMTVHFAAWRNTLLIAYSSDEQYPSLPSIAICMSATWLVLSSTAQVLKKNNIAITRIPPKQVIPVAPTRRKFSIVLIATLRYTEYFDEMKFVHSRSESPLCFESFVATGLTVCIKGKLNRKKNLILVASTQVLDKGEAQVDCPACHFQNTCPNFRVARSLLSH